MEQLGSDPRLWLESEYLSRKRRNSGYSLRAFAKFLDIPSGRLSQLLTAKRRFTPKLGLKLAGRLNFDPMQTEALLEAIQSARSKGKGVDPQKSKEAYRAIEMDSFRAIADPVHFSILSLLELTGFDGSVKAIASSLGMSTVEARIAADRLERMGFVKKEKGKYRILAKESRTTSHDVSSAALRQAHKKVLQDAADSLDEVAVELRDVTSMTMAIDPRKIPEAKARIREFRRSLSEFLESDIRTEVYRINIQLMPVTKKRVKQ
jgi:uncharacterized protein (TIGR02147 family)